MKTTMFQAVCIADGTWKITGAGCDCYLLCGKEEAVMIDAGCSEGNIREFAATLTDLPLRRVINTHSHFDHTGGNGYFDEILVTAGIARSAKNHMDLDAALYPMDYGFTIMEDGSVLDLGERELEVILLDCHSPGSLAVLDRRHRLLFSGDELEAGQVLLLPGYAERKRQVHATPGASVEQFLEAMDKLYARREEFHQICPAHNGSPIAPCYLDWYRELAKGILDGRLEGDRDCSSLSYAKNAAHYPFPHADYRRAEWRGASLVYCAHRIRKSDCTIDTLPATPLHLISAYAI